MIKNYIKTYRDDKPYLYGDHWLTSLRAVYQQREVQRFLQGKRVFFILSTGRCGTTLLARLLGQATDTTVLHEPVALDWAAMPRAYRFPASAIRYVRRYRAVKIYEAIKRSACSTYGETTPPLIYHAKALREYFPHARLVHLSRNGRDVVRSWMNRDVYVNPGDRAYRRLEPVSNDPWRKEWSDLDRFARCCWLWSQDNLWLLKNTHHRARFEDILSDYTLFQAQITEPLALDVDRAQWGRSVKNPINPSKRYNFPGTSEWSREMLSTFNRICGDMMQKLGYD